MLNDRARGLTILARKSAEQVERRIEQVERCTEKVERCTKQVERRTEQVERALSRCSGNAVSRRVDSRVNIETELPNRFGVEMF